MNRRFIADVHLGKLARLLRLLGLDTMYSNSYSMTEQVAIALAENRTLLTKYAAVEGVDQLQSMIITHEMPDTQLQQVIRHFNLTKFHPFSRCLVCNGLLIVVSKESILSHVPPNTAKHFNEFWQCDHCGRVYWKGSHYHRMVKWMEELGIGN